MPRSQKYRGLRRTANRRAIMDAAEELFGRHGYAAVSVDEVTARAGVAKGTFYNHFIDKTDVANQIAFEIRQDMRSRIGAIKSVSPDPASHLAIAMCLFLLLATEQPNRAQILVTLMNNPTDMNSPMNAPVRFTLQNGIESRRFRLTSIEASLIIILGIVSAGIRHIIEQQSEEAEIRVAELVVHALCSLGLEWEDAHKVVNEAMPSCHGVI